MSQSSSPSKQFNDDLCIGDLSQTVSQAFVFPSMLLSRTTLKVEGHVGAIVANGTVEASTSAHKAVSVVELDIFLLGSYSN
jgi:hypothetical protein